MDIVKVDPDIPGEDASPPGIGPFCSVDGCMNPVAVRAPGSRGRAPSKCEDHKGTRSASAGPNASNRKLAEQAAEALAQINGMAGFGLLMVGYTATASAIGDTESKFVSIATSALETDPGLCRVIIRMGTRSAKAGLLIAYGQLAMAIAPVLAIEHRIKVAAREDTESG